MCVFELGCVEGFLNCCCAAVEALSLIKKMILSGGVPIFYTSGKG